MSDVKGAVRKWEEANRIMMGSNPSVLANLSLGYLKMGKADEAYEVGGSVLGWFAGL